MSPSVWKATLGVSRENSQRFWESLSSVGVQLQTKSCRCCFVYDVWCVCYDKRGGNHCLLPSTQQWRASQRVDLLESVESSHTSSTSFLSHLLGEKKESIWFLPFFIYCRRTYARQLGWMKRLAASAMVVVLIHTKPILSPWEYVSRRSARGGGGGGGGREDDWEEQNDVHC
jgi:hypothetical protein